MVNKMEDGSKGGLDDFKPEDSSKEPGRETEYKLPSTNDPEKELETEPAMDRYDLFRKEQTVFGEKEDGLEYDYSDRIVSWDAEKAKEANRVANESGAKRKTQRWYENYLSAYFGKPTELKHIIVGVNRTDGWYYQVFGHRFKDENIEKTIDNSDQ